MSVSPVSSTALSGVDSFINTTVTSNATWLSFTDNPVINVQAGGATTAISSLRSGTETSTVSTTVTRVRSSAGQNPVGATQAGHHSSVVQLNVPESLTDPGSLLDDVAELESSLDGRLGHLYYRPHFLRVIPGFPLSKADLYHL